MADQNFRVKRGLEVGVGVTIQAGIVTAVTLLDGNLNALGKTYYVSTNGNDGYAGTTINRPFATIAKALSVSTSGDVILVQSGTFTEVFPLTIPVGVTVRGTGLRGTFVQPTSGTRQNDGFLLNGETTVEDLTIGNINEPGYAFKFANNSKTTIRSPYIQRVTVLNKGSITSATDPYGFDTAHSPPTSYKAGRGVLIDGSVVDPTTLEPAMLFNECTFICPNNTALEMTNGGRTEWVNCFSYFADKGIRAYDGSVGVGSTGYVRIKTSGLTTTSSTPAANDELYYLEANYQSGTYAQVGTALTITRVGHGLTVGDRIFADFTSGTATDGFYRVTGYVGVNTFSVTMGGSTTTSGNVSYKEALGFGTVRSYTSATGLSSITAKGEGLFELPTSRLGKTVTAYGDAQLSTLQKKIGTASLYLDGTGDYARCEGGSDFAFSGNFTAEAWIYPTSVTGNRYLFSLGTETTGRYNLFLAAGVVTGNFFGSASTTFGGSISINTWTHIALVRSGSTITAYVNGTALGTTETNSSTIGNTGQLTIGADNSGVNAFVGYVDEVRISNTARYTATFTPATTQFNSDGSDKLLLHLDGASASTSFIDSSIPAQDIRWVRSGVGIATATKITLADYQQFGAEMRSIGSAVVFGNTGISADGPGVGLRMFAFNFGHIGSGKDFSQDVSLVNQAAEVVKTNNANVYFVSIDQGGDFRVGDAFYVNQEAGTVNFGGQNFTLNSLSDLNVTDGTNTNTLTPTYLTVGNIQISGNEITSTSGNININPSGNSETNIDGNLNVSGILTASVLQTSALQIGDTAIAIDDTGSNGTIRLNTDGLEVLRATNTQRIGIGTTVPTAKLDVLGDTRITGVITAITFSGNVNGGVGTITNLNSTTGNFTTANATTGNIVTGVVTTISGTGAFYNTGTLQTGNIVTGIVTTLFTSGTATIATGNIVTGVVTTISGTNAFYNTGTLQTGNIVTGIVTTLFTSGTATIATGNIVTGVVTTLSGTNATYTTGNLTTLNATTGNIVTGVVTTISGTNAFYNTGTLQTGNIVTGVVTTLSGSNATYTTGNLGTLNATTGNIVTGVVTTLSGSNATYTTGNFTTANATTGNIVTGVVTTLSGTNAFYNTGTLQTGNIVTGIVTTLFTSGTATIATGNIVTGVVTTLSGSNATYTTGNFTTANATTGNIVTGVVTTLSGTNATYTTGNFGTVNATTGNIVTGIVTTLFTSGTATIATGNIVTGVVTTLSGSNATYTTGNFGTANATTGNIVTGVVTTISGTNAFYNTGTLQTGNIVTGIVTTISGTNATYTTGNFTTANVITGNIVTGVVTTISGTNLNYSGVGTFTTRLDVGTGVTISSGVVTAITRLSTGNSGVGINITTNTISGPSEITIDPAGVGDNTGAVRIKGDLYVDGTQTIINSATIELADFIVGIASTATTDLLADGAGIKIGPDNTLLYDHVNTALKSSENFSLASGKVYKINGTDVLSSTTLGSGVVNSSLTSVGTLGSLNVTGTSNLPTINVTTGYIATGVVTTLSGSNATYTTGNFTTVNATTGNIVTGVVTTLSGTNATYATGNFTTANATTGNIVTGVVTTLSGTNATYTTGNFGTVNATTGNIVTGVVTTISGTSAFYNTGTLQTGNIVTGVVTTLSGTNATYTTGNFTTANATTGNIVTGVVTFISGTHLNYSGVGTFTTQLKVGTGVTISSGIVTATTRLSTGDSGVGINIDTNTISGPSVITIDPAGVGDNTGSVRIKGDFYVDGTQTVVNSTAIELADFVVGIAGTVTSDLLLDGAGIGIGSTASRKTLTWDYTNTALKSSENFNLASGKVYEINGVTLLTNNQLTISNINATGVSTLGTINNTTANIGTANATTGNIVTGVVTTLSGTNATYTTGNFGTANVTTGNIVTGVVTTISGTSAFYNTGTLQTGNIVTGVVTTLSGTNATYTTGNFTTANATTGNIVTGVVTTLSGSNATYTTGNFGTANVTTGNIVTGVVTTISGTNAFYNTGTLQTGNIVTGVVTTLSGSNATYTTGNFTTANATTGNIVTGVVTTISGTSAFYNTGTLQTGNIVTGIVTTLFTSGTATIATGNIVTGVVTTLSGSNATYTTGNLGTLNATTGNIVTGVVTTISGTNAFYNTGTLQTGNIVTGIVTTLFTSGTATIATGNIVTGVVTTISGTNAFYNTGTLQTGNIVTGVVTTLSGTNATYTTGNFGTANATTGNIVTGVVTTLSGTNIRYTGIATFGNTVVGGGTTQLVVTGDARVTGILTVGTVTATAFVGDGSGLTNLPGGGGGSSQWVTTNAGIHTLSNVGIGTTNPTAAVTSANTAVLAAGIVTAYKIYGDGSGLTGVGFALTVGTRTAGINSTDAVSNVRAIRFAKAPFAVQDLGNGEVLINSESSFNPIIIGGNVNDKVQATGEETLNLIAGSGISIVANNTSNPKSLTFTATGGGGGGSSQWETTNAGINTLSNVGIGTTNPTTGLVVRNNTTTTSASIVVEPSFNTRTAAISLVNTGNSMSVGVLNVSGATGYSGGSNFLNGPAYGGFIGVQGALPLIFATNNTEVVRISANGLVGIGSTIPTSKLTVSGNTLITGILTATSLVRSGGTSSQFLKADGSVDSSTYLTSYTETDTLNSVTGRGNVTTNGISIGVLTATIGNFSGIITSSGASISGVVTATSLVRSGGTSSQFLKADGSVDSSTYLTTTGNGVNLTGIVTSIVAGTNVTISGSTGQVTINASGGGSSQWVTTNAGIHTLSNVGVGTTNPNVKLDVLGDVRVVGVVTASSFSGNATSATYATSAGISTYATTAGVSTYATSSGIATYATTSGIATYATSAGVATYATTAGIATYATSAGVSTNVIGGISSVTQLQVAGVSTFTNGPVLIGSGTSTGTASQRLQVTGGAYVSGSVGIGTTNPKTKFELNGVLGFSTYSWFGETTCQIKIGDSQTGKSLSPSSKTGNILIGVGAGSSLSSGDYNTFIGQESGYFSTSDGNTFVGSNAGYFNTSGFNNTFVGRAAGQSNDTGYLNSAFGQSSGLSNTSGDYNVYLGASAGSSNQTGNSNIYLGGNTGLSANASFKIIIGSGDPFGNVFDSPDTTKDIQLAIGVRTDSNESKYWLVGNENFNVGIGTTNPTVKLDVLGNVRVVGVVTATDFNSSSDAALKNNVRTIEDPLAKVMSIRGVNFEWKESGQSSAGVLAQEIEKIMPELVNESNDGIKSVNYNGLIGLLIEVVKEQQNQINELKSKLS